MCTKWFAMLLCALVGAAALPRNVLAASQADLSGGPPELALASVIDDDTLELYRFSERMVTRTTITPTLPPGVTIEARAGTIEPVLRHTEVVPVTERQITRVSAAEVEVRRIDGRVVSHKVLLEELAKPTPVLFVKEGGQIDPIFLKMFKPESLMLSLPAPGGVGERGDGGKQRLIPKTSRDK